MDEIKKNMTITKKMLASDEVDTRAETQKNFQRNRALASLEIWTNRFNCARFFLCTRGTP